MRKTSILLLLILVAILSSCTPETEPVEGLINESEDTKQDIINILRLYLTETKVFTIENTKTSDSDFTITFPFYKEDINSTYLENEYTNSTNDSGILLYQILEVMKEDLDQTEIYQEDAWNEITNSSNQRVCQYRVFINDRELVFRYYYIGDENNIIGIYGNISDKDQKLEYTINTIEYFYKEDQFNKVSQSYYREEDMQYDRSMYLRPGGFDELTYTEYDYEDRR